MRLKTYALLVVLYCLIGLCTVHEVTKQTEARYRLAELLQEELRVVEDLALLKTEYATLSDPARLEALNRQLNLNLMPLQPLANDGPEPVAQSDNP